MALGAYWKPDLNTLKPFSASKAYVICSNRAGQAKGLTGRRDLYKISLILTIEQLHRLACESGVDTYTDPASGYLVLTSQAYLKRGMCCGNSCRHCPFEYINIPKNSL